MSDLIVQDASEAFSQPIFIVGPGRAGSTLLRVMLNSHSELDISKESYFIPRLVQEWQPGMSDHHIDAFFSRLKRFPREPEQAIIDYLEWDHSQLLELLKESRDESYPEIVKRIFTARTKRLGKTFWGNKTPNYCFHMPRLLELFPGSRFIFLVRDGRDVTLSYQSCDWGPDNVLEGARYWQNVADSYEKFQVDFPSAKIFLARYEDLVTKPEQALKQICDFIGVCYEPAILAFNNNISAHFGSSEKLKDHQKLKEPARTDRIARWRQEMNSREIAQFESIAGSALTTFGYEHYSPKSVDWLWFYGARLWSRFQNFKHQLTKSSAWIRKQILNRFGNIQRVNHKSVKTR